MATVFSKIIAGDIPAFKVAESEHYFAFLDINPLVAGHTLVVPKKETDYLFDMDDMDFQGLFLFSKKVARAIESVVPCLRIGVAVIGLEVPHAHIHLVPLNSMDDINFSRKKLKIPTETMQELAGQILRAYTNLPD